MATRRRFARSARRSGSPRRAPCTRIWRTSSARACSTATRPSRARSSCGRDPSREPVQAEPTCTGFRSLGQIAAGGPLLAEQNVEEYVAVPEPLARGGEEFLLRVKGESMINAGILDGDFVVVRRQQDANERRHRRRARGRRRDRRGGDGQAVLQGERPRPAPAGERRARADLRRSRPGAGQGHGSVPDRCEPVAPINRTLDQELNALLRGVSLECLVCGEFVLHRRGRRSPAPSAGRSTVKRREPRLQLSSQAG